MKRPRKRLLMIAWGDLFNDDSGTSIFYHVNIFRPRSGTHYLSCKQHEVPPGAYPAKLIIIVKIIPKLRLLTSSSP